MTRKEARNAVWRALNDAVYAIADEQEALTFVGGFTAAEITAIKNVVNAAVEARRLLNA